MTHFVLCRAGGLELGIAGDPVVDAESMPVVGDAVTILRSLETMREAALRSSETHRAQALQSGLSEARAIAESEVREAIAQAAARFEEALYAEREDRRHRDVELALAIVARIAGEVGESTMIAALARTVIAELDVAPALRVRVHPGLEPEVRTALSSVATNGGRPSIDVVGDERLGRFGCEIDQGDAIFDASLGVQLRAIRDALSSVEEAAT